MKLSHQYELMMSQERPQLVDVTACGKDEGFDDSDDLRECAYMVVAGMRSPEKEIRREAILALIRRAESGRFQPGDVMDAFERFIELNKG